LSRHEQVVLRRYRGIENASCVHNQGIDEEQTMRKLLQNTFFAAMMAWALQGIQAHMEQRAVTAGAHVGVPMLAHVAWQP
jgi:hypothetical protein